MNIDKLAQALNVDFSTKPDLIQNYKNQGIGINEANRLATEELTYAKIKNLVATIEYLANKSEGERER